MTLENPYYQKELFLAQVDRDDKIVGRVERWKAHREGICHRGFTAILVFNDQIILQHRKHKAFDNLWDLTFSSHQIYQREYLQSDDEAIFEALTREWNLNPDAIAGGLLNLGSVYYNAKDPKSEFTEHEVDYVYLVKLNQLPTANPNYAYGQALIPADWSNISVSLEKYPLAPWVEKILDTLPAF